MSMKQNILERRSADGVTDGEEDFFNNPLKHLLPKVMQTETNKSQKTVRKKAGNKCKNNEMKNVSKATKRRRNGRKRHAALESLVDEDDELLADNRNDGGDAMLSKVEQELKEMEDFSKTVISSSSTDSKKKLEKNTKSYVKRKTSINGDVGSVSSSDAIDQHVVKLDDSVVAVNEIFVIKPYCSIEICDLECCDTDIMRWQMTDTFEDIVRIYALKWSCSESSVVLSMKCGKEVSAKDTPSSLAFSEKDVNYLSIHKNAIRDKDSSNQITIKWLLSGQDKPIISSVRSDVPFNILKHDFAVKHCLDERELQLFFDSSRINLQESAITLGIEDGDCIDVYIWPSHLNVV